MAGDIDRLLHDMPSAGTMQQSIAVSCLQSAQQQTHRPLLLLSIDGTDRRTDGRTRLSPGMLTR